MMPKLISWQLIFTSSLISQPAGTNRFSCNRYSKKTHCFVKNNKPGDNFRKKHEITQSNRTKPEKPGIEYQADTTFLTPTKIKPVKICIFETNF